jgi:hypothetical protein
MYRIATIVVACLIVAGCSKEQTVANCRLDVARKWNEDVLKTCIEPWSPFANKNASLPNPVPKCSDVDQAQSFMRLCMKTAGYEFVQQCADRRFKPFDRKCYVALGLKQLFDSLVESDLLSDTTTAPWIGYAWHKGNKRLEWVNQYETLGECINKLKHIISDDAFNSQFYSAPIGCGYNGNSYWRVWLMNALWGGRELGCIATREERKEEATDTGMLYGPVLGRESNRPADAKWHCV